MKDDRHGRFAIPSGATEFLQHVLDRCRLLPMDDEPNVGMPSAIALRDNSIVLPDRCVVAELDRRLKDGLTKSGGGRDFIDLFADHAIRINPALFALEGDEIVNRR